MKYKLTYNREWFILIISLLYTLLFNTYFVLNRLYKYNILSTPLLISIIVEILISWVISYLFFYSLTIHKKSFIFVMTVVFITTALAKYFLINLGFDVTQSTLKAIFATDIKEAKDLLNVGILIEIITAFCIAIILATIFNKHDKTNNKISLIAGIICLVLVLMGIFLNGAKINAKYYPYNIFKETAYYLLDQFSLYKTRTDIAHSYKFNIEEKNSEDLVVVLVIGESARFDHFGINGYHRPTSPYLSKTTNLLSFQEITACAAMTMDALPCIMTRSTDLDRSIGRKETSFVGIMRKLGFETIWLGSQGSSSFNRHYYEFGKEAEHHVFLDDLLTTANNKKFDTDLIPYIEKFLANPGKKLIVFHSIGSHFHYDLRTPNKFKKFTPTCIPNFQNNPLTDCTKEQIINSYDNSIFYTDFFLGHIINLLQKQKALLLYISDHGESLGERGVYMHGNSTIKEQIHVPMFVFASDSYIKNYSANFQNMKKKLSTPLTQDIIFHSILDCSFISSEIINKNLSICK